MYFFAAVIATGTFVFGGLILVNCGSSRIATVTPYIGKKHEESLKSTLTLCRTFNPSYYKV